MLKTFRIACSR